MVDYTNDISDMLAIDIFDAQSLDLALALATCLRQWTVAAPQDKEEARMRVLSILVDALVPPSVVETYDYGETLADLVRTALDNGLDLDLLCFRLTKMLKGEIR